MENESIENKSTEEETVVDNKEEITEKTSENNNENNNVNNNESKKKGFFSRMSTPKKIILIIVVVLLLAVAAAGVTLLVIRGKGEASLRDMSGTLIDSMAMEESKQVYYDGKEYKYNDKLINILLIGNDSQKTVAQLGEANEQGAGLADTLFLVTIDPEKKSVDCISINRHTMAKIDLVVPGFGVINNYETQVTRQYSYGTGLEDSCELTVKAVSGIFGNIPIHGYASLSLNAIKPLNHVVGGVEVEVLEAIPGEEHNEIMNRNYGIGDSLLNAVGKTITLTDDQAYAYLRHRGQYVGDSDKRLDRQRQYLKALFKKIIDNTKKDITFPMKVRDALSDWLVTDIDDNEMIYLVSSLIFYKLNIDSVAHLPGTVSQGEDTAEQFYPDEDGMKKIVIERFYKPAD